MVRSIILFLALLRYPLPAQTPPGGPSPDQLNRVDALLGAEFAKQKYGSVTAAMICGNQIVWMKSYGLADMENNVSANSDTVYNIASIGKKFTALMLLQLVERGRVHLSDPVERHVPEIRQVQNPYAGAGPVTLIQLATHTSGLTGIDPLPPPGARLEWGQALVSVLPQIRFDSEPGTRYQ